MNCVKCGTYLPSDANYCLKCGKKQRTARSKKVEPPEPVWEICVIRDERVKAGSLQSVWKYGAWVQDDEGERLIAESPEYFWPVAFNQDKRVYDILVHQLASDGWEPTDNHFKLRRRVQ